jgi:hypothetical protein
MEIGYMILKPAMSNIVSLILMINKDNQIFRKFLPSLISVLILIEKLLLFLF